MRSVKKKQVQDQEFLEGMGSPSPSSVFLSPGQWTFFVAYGWTLVLWVVSEYLNYKARRVSPSNRRKLQNLVFFQWSRWHWLLCLPGKPKPRLTMSKRTQRERANVIKLVRYPPHWKRAEAPHRKLPAALLLYSLSCCQRRGHVTCSSAWCLTWKPLHKKGQLWRLWQSLGASWHGTSYVIELQSSGRLPSPTAVMSWLFFFLFWHVSHLAAPRKQLRLRFYWTGSRQRNGRGGCRCVIQPQLLCAFLGFFTCWNSE